MSWKDYALLLVDVQQGFWGEHLAKYMPDFPRQVARLLELCRQESLPVVHVRLSFRIDGADWPPFEKLGQPLTCLEGTAAREPTEFAREAMGEAVIYKHALDGFVAPALEQQLRALETKCVLVAGLITSVCVLLTALSATQRGYLTAIVEDACADGLEPHQFALTHFQGFGFLRTHVDAIRSSRVAWDAMLAQLTGSAHRFGGLR
jgi:nicotinamidase-related amidase